MYLQEYNMLGRKEYPPQLSRKTKIVGQKLKINLRAEIEPGQRLKRKPPKLCKKNKGGAPRENRNAVKTGLHTTREIARRRQVRACIVEMKRLAAQYHLYAAMKNIETGSRLRAAGLASLRLPALPASAPE